jgi:Ca2+-binding RTX toxin-like protein
VLDLSGAQSGNNLNNLGTFVGTGDTLGDTYNWSVNSGADSHIVVDATTGQLSANGIAAGTYTFTVTATDPDAIANPSKSVDFTLLVGDSGNADDIIPNAPTYVLSASNNIEVGLAGNDNLTGSAGTDYILGSGNDDVIKGLGGADILSGGTGGKDKFVYTAASDSLIGNGDKIYQFDGGTTGAHDTLDFTALHIVSADVTVSNSGGNTIVQANTNGTAGAEMEITLVGVTLDKAHIDILY